MSRAKEIEGENREGILICPDYCKTFIIWVRHELVNRWADLRRSIECTEMDPNIHTCIWSFSTWLNQLPKLVKRGKMAFSGSGTRTNEGSYRKNESALHTIYTKIISKWIKNLNGKWELLVLKQNTGNLLYNLRVCSQDSKIQTLHRKHW